MTILRNTINSIFLLSLTSSFYPTKAYAARGMNVRTYKTDKIAICRLGYIHKNQVLSYPTVGRVTAYTLTGKVYFTTERKVLVEGKAGRPSMMGHWLPEHMCKPLN